MAYRTIIEYIYIIELVLFSGGVVFSGTFPKTCFIIWLITACLLIKTKGHRIKLLNLKTCLLISFWIIFVQFFIYKEYFNASILNYLIYIIGSIGISTFSFHRFRFLLLRVMTYLAFISIVVHLGYELGILTATTHSNYGGQVFDICIAFFNVGWPGGYITQHRLSSVFWEPGQYQIIIIYTLSLFLNQITDFSNIKDWMKNFLILIIAIILAQSTTGYLVFALLIVFSYLFTRNFKREQTAKRVFISLFSSSLILISVLFLWNSSIVQGKLQQRESGSEDTSYAIRMVDNMSCLTVALESPIFGYGVNTNNLSRRLSFYGNITSSNGWLLSAASLGFVYVFILIFMMYYRIDDMKNTVPPLFVLLVLFLSQCNEYALYFPYTYIYIYKFRRY